MQHSFGKAFHHSMRSGSDLSVIGLVVPTSSLMMDNTDDDFASTYPDLEEHHEGLALVGEWRGRTFGAYTPGIPATGQSFSPEFQQAVA